MGSIEIAVIAHQRVGADLKEKGDLEYKIRRWSTLIQFDVSNITVCSIIQGHGPVHARSVRGSFVKCVIFRRTVAQRFASLLTTVEIRGVYFVLILRTILELMNRQ